MPIVKVGEQRIKFPDDMSQEDILAALNNRQPQAEEPVQAAPVRTGRGIGAQGAIRDRAEALAAIRAENPILADELEAMSGVEAFLIGAGQGLTNVGQGVKRLFGGEAQPTPESIQQLQSVSPSAQAGEIVGEASPFLAPGLGIGNIGSQGARVAASGALGGVEGGLISAGRGGDSGEIATAAGFGTLIGGGSEALLPVLNRVGRSLGFDDVLSADGQINAELAKRLSQNGATTEDLLDASRILDSGEDIVGNAERESVFRRLGLNPTEAQRTRDVDLFVEQQDAFKRSGLVRDALDLQETQLTERTAQAITELGGTGSPVSVIDAITDRSLRLDDEINQLYKAAREAAQGGSIVSPKAAVQSLRSNSSRNEVSGGVVRALRDEMAQQGVAQGKGFKASGRMSVEQSESLRQFANSLVEGANPQGRLVIREFKEGLDNDVFKAAGEDVFQAARQAKTNFERGLTKQAKNKFDRNRVSLVRDLLENKVSPDDVRKLVSSGGKYKSADLEDLKRYLFDGTPEDVARGQAAWNDLRTAAMEQIQEKAFIGAVRADGSQSLSRAGLERGIKSIGQDKIRVLFSKEERQFLRDLADVAALKEPPPATALGSGPTGAAIQRLQEKIIRNAGIPGGDIANDVLGGIAERRVSRSQAKKLLKLGDDAEKIRRKNAKDAFERLRKSQIGTAASAVPFTVIPAVQSEEE